MALGREVRACPYYRSWLAVPTTQVSTCRAPCSVVWGDAPHTATLSNSDGPKGGRVSHPHGTLDREGAHGESEALSSSLPHSPA